ncbi:MAG TPA: hypothetical protein VGO52_26680 [Hyphomonadaceae bacterium]|jgi:hypothetical protein|nr:hypothetical protein [Hyphomonadaceae bacterium]
MPLNLRNMSDMELERLHGDSIRLSQSGTAAQRAEAEQILPRVGDEIARRRRVHVRDVNKKREDADTARRAKQKKAPERDPEKKKQ